MRETLIGLARDLLEALVLCLMIATIIVLAAVYTGRLPL